MKLLVLDGNSIVNRAFYGIKLLTTKSGEFTNGIVGFLNILEKLKEETQPDAVAIAFDMRAPTFRHKAFAGYKAQRKGMPPELAAQMPLLKELLQDLGYRIVTCEGWEADDILGTFAKACEENGDTCMIATGDRDSLQLVSGQTTVRLATTKFGQSAVTVYDEAKIQEDYGVSPRQLIDIKAIQGDTSDNIPGVAGIGEKGAGELIRKFGSLQYIYDNLDTLDIKPGMRAKLEASKDNAFLSYDLGTIRQNAPIDTALADYVPAAGDPAAAAALMTRLELFKLMERLHITPGAAAVKTEAGAGAEALPVHEYTARRCSPNARTGARRISCRNGTAMRSKSSTSAASSAARWRSPRSRRTTRSCALSCRARRSRNTRPASSGCTARRCGSASASRALRWIRSSRRTS